MEKLLCGLGGKLKRERFTIGKTEEVVVSSNLEALSRHEASIANKIKAVHALQEEIEELKFLNNETEEQVESWEKSINEELMDADTKVVAIRARLKKIDEEEIAIEREQKRKEQLATDNK